MSSIEPKTYDHLCWECKDKLDWEQYTNSVSGIAPEIPCGSCGRTKQFDKVKVYYTTVNESGNEERRSKMVDWNGDTPLIAINRVLEAHKGPRGERVKEIRRVEINRTPPLREEERGERSVVYEEAGLIVHDISLKVEK